MVIGKFTYCQITSLVIPGMVERKRGLIINLASFIALRPAIGYTVYGSTKAFIAYFTESLRMEHEKDNIEIQVHHFRQLRPIESVISLYLD